MSPSKPSPNDFHEYYQRYVDKVGSDVMKDLAAQPKQLKKALGKLEPEQENCLHEPYTWTLKQVLGHMIDCERTFASRLFRIGVGDETPIPGFDQNLYVDNLDYSGVPMKALLKEFQHLRKSTILLVERLGVEALEKRGVASDNPVSAKANLFILVGHVTYHLEIIKKRLGINEA